jgi:hypothetical protein
MNQRFEINVEPQGYNIFLIDDYLRSLRSREERLKVINTVGYSAEKREEFERSRGLPRGAVELALVCEDRQLQEINGMLNEKLAKMQADKAPPEQVNEVFREIGSRAAGIRALYPEAFQFLNQYTALAKRNASAFRGDYRFNNEYKILKADCSPSSNANTQVDADVCSNVNTCVTVNLVAFLAIYAYVAVVAWVGALEFLAFAIYVWAAVFVIP